jgi:hypothetical protein
MRVAAPGAGSMLTDRPLVSVLVFLFCREWVNSCSATRGLSPRKIGEFKLQIGLYFTSLVL